MANVKNKFILFIVVLFLGVVVNNSASVFANNNIASVKNTDYDAIYDSLSEPSFDYIFNLDPYQPDEYTKYMYSPYPLFRSGVNLIFKSKVIPPGYYLLTPREKDGKTYVLFKENGRVSFVIPVYDEDWILETFYDDKLPKVNKTKTQKMRDKTMDFIGKHWGDKNQRTPMPKSYIEFNDKGLYWDMILYYGEKKYYLLFKKEE